jgi:hypothetical protein
MSDQTIKKLSVVDQLYQLLNKDDHKHLTSLRQALPESGSGLFIGDNFRLTKDTDPKDLLSALMELEPAIDPGRNIPDVHRHATPPHIPMAESMDKDDYMEEASKYIKNGEYIKAADMYRQLHEMAKSEQANPPNNQDQRDYIDAIINYSAAAYYEVINSPYLDTEHTPRSSSLDAKDDGSYHDYTTLKGFLTPKELERVSNSKIWYTPQGSAGILKEDEFAGTGNLQDCVFMALSSNPSDKEPLHLTSHNNINSRQHAGAFARKLGEDNIECILYGANSTLNSSVMNVLETLYSLAQTGLNIRVTKSHVFGRDNIYPHCGTFDPQSRSMIPLTPQMHQRDLLSVTNTPIGSVPSKEVYPFADHHYNQRLPRFAFHSGVSKQYLPQVLMPSTIESILMATPDADNTVIQLKAESNETMYTGRMNDEVLTLKDEINHQRDFLIQYLLYDQVFIEKLRRESEYSDPAIAMLHVIEGIKPLQFPCAVGIDADLYNIMTAYMYLENELLNSKNGVPCSFVIGYDQLDAVSDEKHYQFLLSLKTSFEKNKSSIDNSFESIAEPVFLKVADAETLIESGLSHLHPRLASLKRDAETTLAHLKDRGHCLYDRQLLYLGDHPQRDDINDTFHIISRFFRRGPADMHNTALQKALKDDSQPPFFDNAFFEEVFFGLVQSQDGDIKIPTIIEDNIRALNKAPRRWNRAINGLPKTLDTCLKIARFFQNNTIFEANSEIASRLLQEIAEFAELEDLEDTEVLLEVAEYLCPKVKPQAINKVYKGITKTSANEEFLNVLKRYIPRDDDQKPKNQEGKPQDTSKRNKKKPDITVEEQQEVDKITERALQHVEEIQKGKFSNKGQNDERLKQQVDKILREANKRMKQQRD